LILAVVFVLLGKVINVVFNRL